MIKAYNTRTKQLTQVEHHYLLKPASEWIINPLIDDSIYTVPNSDWVFNESTTELRAMTADELDTDPERLAIAKRNKKEELSAACQNEITAGYWSSALSQARWYDAAVSDQLNLMASISATQPSEFYEGGSMFISCRQMGPDGVKTFENHTHIQLKQVLDDGIAARTRLLQKFSIKCLQIDSCDRISQISALNW